MGTFKKSIRIEDQQQLERLLQQLQTISERLIHLLSNNQMTLFPSFFNENHDNANADNDFYGDRRFQNKLESYIRYSSVTVTQLASEYFHLASQVVVKNERPATAENYEAAARKYFHALNKTNTLLSELVRNRLSTTHLVKTPNITDDIQNLENCVKGYEQKVNDFAQSLDDVSRQLVEDAIAVKEDGPHHPIEALNYKIAIDALSQEYQQAYDKAFGASGFWRKIKEKFQNSDRHGELTFLKAISDHENSNDAIRYQAMVLVHNKIKEAELFGKSSHLKTILHHLSSNGYRGLDNAQNDLNKFIHDHQEISIPKSLSDYFNAHEQEYSNATIGLV